MDRSHTVSSSGINPVVRAPAPTSAMNPTSRGKNFAPASSPYLNINTMMTGHDPRHPITPNNDPYLNLVSPKSDKSDSSLNLNHSSFMNPSFTMAGLDSASSIESSSSFGGPHGLLSYSMFLPPQEKLNSKSVKKEKEKKKKRVDGETRSNKCTVAALLSQFNRDKPASEEPRPPSSMSASNPTPPPIIEQQKPLQKFVNRKKSEKLASSPKKNSNKLRDYFGPSAIEGEKTTDHELLDPMLDGRPGKSGVKKRRGLGDSQFEREISVATKKLKPSCELPPSDPSSLFNVDYSSQSQLVFEISCEDGLRVISYDINSNISIIGIRTRSHANLTIIRRLEDRFRAA